MANIFRGTPNPKRQVLVERWSPTSGFSAEWSWKGISEAQLRNYFAAYASAGCECEFTDQHGVYTLIAKVPNPVGGSQVVIDKWEVGLNKLSLAVSRHPVVIAILGRSGDANTVRSGIKQFLDGTEQYEDITDLAPVDSSDDAVLKAMLNQARDGADAFYFSSYTLRHTTNTSNRWNVNVADTGVDRIYTTAQLLSETQNANSWNYPLPGRLAFKLLAVTTNITAQYPITDPYYQWGWLKFGSPESTVANNRVDIVTEYEFGLISTLLYSTF
jgi:hypothetical protein